MASQLLGVFETLSQSTHTQLLLWVMSGGSSLTWRMRGSCIKCFLTNQLSLLLLTYRERGDKFRLGNQSLLLKWPSASIITHPRDQKAGEQLCFGCATCINTAVRETHTPFPMITAGLGGSLNSEQGQKVSLSLKLELIETENDLKTLLKHGGLMLMKIRCTFPCVVLNCSVV